MSVIDLGDVTRLTFTTTDATGTLANAGQVQITLTLPDQTTAGPTTVTPASTGSYEYDYTPTLAGRHVVRWVATGANAAAYTDVFDVAPAASAALVSLADAKVQLNIPASNTTDDDEIRGYIQAATEIVNRKCGYCAPTVFTEVVAGRADASGRSMIVLSRTPILSVTSITPQLQGVPTVDLTAVIDNAEAGIVYMSNWYQFYGPVTVVYTAGRAVVPAALQTACLMIVEELFKTQRGGGVAVPGTGNESETVDGVVIPAAAALLMDASPYRAAPGIA